MFYCWHLLYLPSRALVPGLILLTRYEYKICLVQNQGFAATTENWADPVLLVLSKPKTSLNKRHLHKSRMSLWSLLPSKSRSEPGLCQHRIYLLLWLLRQAWVRLQSVRCGRKQERQAWVTKRWHKAREEGGKANAVPSLILGSMQPSQRETQMNAVPIEWTAGNLE